MAAAAVPVPQKGAAVYALSNANFLPKESIMEGKGTDASNQHDEEAEEEDFSDDEQVHDVASGRQG